MAKKQHTEYIESETTFVNPYNFVSVDKQKIENHRKGYDEIYSQNEHLHTGYLECSLLTKTPLSIPESVGNEDEEIAEHYRYPFFRVSDKSPIIPGSSIRGVLRSAYETLTDSCFSTMREDTRLSKRMETSDVNGTKTGILVFEENEWKLYRAEKYIIYLGKKDTEYSPYNKKKDTELKENLEPFELKVDNNSRVRTIYHNNQMFHFGDLVKFKGYKHYIKEIVDNNSEDGETLEGVFYIGESFDNKHGEAIFCFEKDKHGNRIIENVSSEEIIEAKELMERTISVYRDKAINNKESHSGYAGYESAERNGYIPVWYRKFGNGKIRLSLAAVGRMFYRKSLNSIIGELAPCKSKEHICKACALFGMTGKTSDNKQQNVSFGSRIRVTDAKPVEYNMIGEKTLKELGSPKYTYLPFYTKDGKGYDSNAVEIRGRKYYWHNPNLAESDYIAVDDKDRNIKEKTKRNGTYELVGKESLFKFRIYYDEITEEQLDELMWLVSLGENEKEGNMCYKIGHGKPLGLGSVKMIVDTKNERSFNLDEGYRISCEEGNINDYISSISVNFNKTIMDEFLSICRFDAITDKISYPYIEKVYDDAFFEKHDLEAHKWFVEFKKKKENVLPVIMMDKKSLHTYKTGRDKIYGTLKFYNREKGFGFVTDGNGNDAYLRSSSICDYDISQYKNGVSVEYSVRQGEKGLEVVECYIVK